MKKAECLFFIITKPVKYFSKTEVSIKNLIQCPAGQVLCSSVVDILQPASMKEDLNTD